MTYRFGPYELNCESHELARDGTVISIEPQVFDLLIFFVKHANKLITSDDLIESVWAGRIVSDSAIAARISAARSAIGDDGKRQQMIKTVPRKGFRFVCPVEIVGQTASRQETPKADPPSTRQSVRFCTSRDGTRIAYARSGSGVPLLRAGHWLTHLEHDWHSPIWRPFLEELGKRCEITRYDQRGNGLSDWNLDGFSLDTCVEDLEVVADAAGLDTFFLMGSSQGAPVALRYAVEHPERVRGLILCGGYVQGRSLRDNADERARGDALHTLIKLEWGQPGAHFIKAFAAMYIPGGSQEQVDSMAELQRLTTSPENASPIRRAIDLFDASDVLARVDVPTLIIHARNDGIHPIDQARKLAAGIKGAEFVMLESDNHIVLEHEPAWKVFFGEIDRFIGSQAFG